MKKFVLVSTERPASLRAPLVLGDQSVGGAGFEKVAIQGILIEAVQR
jgi:hypothetical protein